MDKPKILITGANGFVGYHLVEAALRKGMEVHAGVRGNSNTASLHSFPIHIVSLDYADKDRLRASFEREQYDYVIHAAGATKAGSETEYNQANALNTDILSAALDFCRPEKFVFLSSLAAMGPTDYGTDQIIRLEDAPKPVTRYGRSKLYAEELLRGHKELPWIILRPTAVYGPREKDLFVMIKTLARGLETYIGRRRQMLSFVYVKDLAEVALQACVSEVQHQTYHISDGAVYSRYEVSDIIKKILNRKTVALHVPEKTVRNIAGMMERISGKKTPLLNKDKIAELVAENWQCDIEPAQKDLAYQPKYLLREGMKETINWYRDNKWI